MFGHHGLAACRLVVHVQFYLWASSTYSLTQIRDYRLIDRLVLYFSPISVYDCYFSIYGGGVAGVE